MKFAVAFGICALLFVQQVAAYVCYFCDDCDKVDDKTVRVDWRNDKGCFTLTKKDKTTETPPTTTTAKIEQLKSKLLGERVDNSDKWQTRRAGFTDEMDDCDKVFENNGLSKDDVDCKDCKEDLCNSASGLKTGILSTLVAAVLLALYNRH